ncbi:hypothetical protein OH77DRAFT_1507471 [Trametes cingulata]|nr:hypothetical protein OH77DRAFT_1507471 [Trametes cingulata]
MALLKITGEATTITWRDARLAAYTPDHMWVIISPNMSFVPLPPMGILEVILRLDYPYGLVDPIQWPQIYSDGYEYLCAIQRPLPPTHRLSSLWWSPVEEHDFQCVEGCALKCPGLLRHESLRGLCDLIQEMCAVIMDAVAARRDFVDDHLLWLEAAMRHARERLEYFPCTFRDAVMQDQEAQRYCLMSSERGTTVNPGFMGAFTMDPGVVQSLFEARIPVWWIRQDASILEDIVIVKITEVQRPHICQRLGIDHGEVLYHGLVGPQHIRATARGGVSAGSQGFEHRRLDAGPSCTTASAVARSVAQARTHPYARASNARKPQVRSINKFVDIVHPWMPAALDVWRDVMSNIDQRATDDRATRYFMMWLRLRPGWLYMLHLRDAVLSRISPQWWRDFLYGDTGRADQKEDTRNAPWAQQFMHIFGQAFQREHLDLQPTAPPTWFGHRLVTLDRSLCPQIVWEISLDRLLAPLRNHQHAEELRKDLLASVFPDRSVYSGGLCAQVLQRRAPYLEAFRCVLSGWPGCPSSIHTGVPITTVLKGPTIIEREREMVKFYVETFYHHSGHAPIVPQIFPRG